MLRRVLVLLFLAAGGAQADGARGQLDRFAAGLDTLQAEFSQVVLGTDGQVQDHSEGQVWLSRPGRFRWEYGGDFPELVVADGRTIWIHDEVLEQVTVRDQGGAEIDSPLSLLTEPRLLDEKFEVREVGELDGALLLELRARSVETEFERLLLGMAEDVPVLMIMEDAFGLRTELRFAAVRRNPELEPALFQFTPPEGVDVIGTLPGAAEEG